MEILTAVAVKIVEFTVGPIVRQVGYIFCYRNNLKKLEDLANELQAKKERIDHKVEAEIRNIRKIEGDVLKWQESVIKTLEDAKQLWKEPHDAKVCCFPNLKSRYQHGRKAKKMADTIVEIKGKGKFDEGVGYVPRLDITNNLPAIRGSDGLESRKLVKEDVVLSLKDPKVNKIGVYGIGGVGKSTLVQEVCKQVKHDKLFDEVLMVTISQENLERIQDEIAEQLGLHLEERTSTSGRANRLCERIKTEKTILIILDDLREKIDLDKLGIPSLDTWGKMNPEKVGVPLKDDYKGCKLLLISKSLDILQKYDTQKNFPLQVLNDEESWSLFEAMVGDVVKDDKFRKIATQVAQRCLGLPVLIVTTAKSLKYNEDIHYWKDTLGNLKRVDGKDMKETINSALEFNFSRLEDEVKKVVLLCGVLGTSIYVSYLLKYAIGLGIFKCVDTIEDARNRLYRIIIDLKASCLLVDANAKSEIIKMHDIVHKVAVSMALEYAFIKINDKLQDWPKEDILERCTHINLSLCCIQKLPERLDCPHLTFLLINSFDNRSLEIPNSFFEGMRNLEALDLTGMIIGTLPISLGSLTKLKTLGLYDCFLKDMIGIGALLNLEILAFIHSFVEEFPSEIKRLTKLRMLDLRRSGIGTTLPNIFCKLTKIEELYMGDATINWEVESFGSQKRNASLAKLGDLTGLTTLEIQIREAWLLPKDIAFEKLERYKIVIGDTWEWSDNKGTSGLLKIKLDTSIHSEQGIKTLIKSVEDLYLDEISGISNVLFELNGEGFPLLRHLHIQNNGEIQHIVDPMRIQTHVFFPKLETMILHNLNKLVKICHSSVRDNSFGKLKIVKVRSCDQLVYLFSASMVKAFSQLVEIEVSECNSMKKIISVESTDSDKTFDEEIEFLPLRSLSLQYLPIIDYFCSHELMSSPGTTENLWMVNISAPFFGAKVKFSNLETLKLSSINLKKIWDDSSAPYLVHNLANLTVEDCSGLKYLFSSSMVGRLSNLKQLEISKCDMMEEIIATEEINGVAIGEVLFPKLEAIIIKDMQSLKTIWHLDLASNSLACLKTLEVKNCEKIEKIFPGYMNGAFATLGCESLEAVFDVKALNDKAMESKGVSGLKKLTLSGLPNLKHIWNGEVGEIFSFGNLQIVQVDECPNLKYVFSPSLCPELRQLEELNIESCGVENIVSNEEGFEELEFYFPMLRIFRLICLMQVNDFYPKRYTLECPSLEVLNVYRCEALQVFRFGQVDSQQHRGVCVDLPIQQALFHIEKVSENLKELSLNEKDGRKILNGNYEKTLFQRIKILRLQYFQETPAKFLSNLIQKFPATILLQTRYSSFETLFISKEFGDCSVGNTTQIKELWLYQLEQLEDIWNDDDSASHPLVQNLEELCMWECSRIIRLAPPSTSFKNLTYLEVGDCNGLMYFMTSCTAKSLIHLKWLRVKNCGMLEEVVVTDDEGQSKEEITFENLKYLELNCLSSFKSFYSGKHTTFIFLSLVTLQVIGCPKMQNFSSGVIIAPFLKLVEVENGKKHWKQDLNTTIKQLFIDKTKGEGVEGDYKESSTIDVENNQTHQKSASRSRALSFDESKAHEIVNSGEQEMHRLPTPHIGIGTQNLCEEITETLDRASQNTSKFTKVDAVIETREMHETIEGDFVQDALNKFSFISVQDAGLALGTQDETIKRHLFQATHQGKLSPSIALQDTECTPDGSQDMQLHLSEDLLVQATASIKNNDEEKANETKKPLIQTTQ
ncbi:hypothetical protein QN277_023320 [Acacia crassicarpa]|uniref:NB-ARC domain-containing protein n=1 Tax=Acacia crassicarpa TaxID=499986 RepID=A0AAE1MJN6_9FABA|nr:hypothetical protein QN277_023320 [Acacia crassicarpa]